MTSSVDPGSLRRLGRNIDGRVMLAGDEGYELGACGMERDGGSQASGGGAVHEQR